MEIAQIILPITVGPLAILLSLSAARAVAVCCERRAKRHIIHITTERIREYNCGAESGTARGEPKHLPRLDPASRSWLAVRIRFRRIKAVAAKRRAGRALVARLGRYNRFPSSSVARARPRDPSATEAASSIGDSRCPVKGEEQIRGVVIPFTRDGRPRPSAQQPAEDRRHQGNERAGESSAGCRDAG